MDSLDIKTSWQFSWSESTRKAIVLLSESLIIKKLFSFLQIRMWEVLLYFT